MTGRTGRINKANAVNEYGRLAALATPLGLVRDQATRRTETLNGWAVRVFPEHDCPELLVLFSKGFVARAISWDSPGTDPRFDLSFRFGFMAIGALPDNLSKIRPDTFHGVCRKWHSQGVLAVETNHQNGLFHGAARIWSESGQLSDESRYKNGKLHGERIIWEKNDSVLVNSDVCRAKYTYREGVLHGPFVKWHPNGTVWIQGENLNGQIHGMFNEYNDEGFRVFKTKYAYGQELWSRLAFGG